MCWEVAAVASCCSTPTADSSPRSAAAGGGVGGVREKVYGWDPSNVRELYHSRGGLLRSVVRSEAVALEVARSCARPLIEMEKGAIRLCKRSAAIRVDRLGSAAVWHAAWRAAFATALGLPPSVANNRRRAVVRGARRSSGS